jgi:hypothetical protein
MRRWGRKASSVIFAYLPLLPKGAVCSVYKRGREKRETVGLVCQRLEEGNKETGWNQ